MGLDHFMLIIMQVFGKNMDFVFTIPLLFPLSDHTFGYYLFSDDYLFFLKKLDIFYDLKKS